MRGPDKVRKLLILPDAHVSPEYSNERFDWLGATVAAERPDVIVCLGDYADMGSLSSYERGKRGFEGRRYVHDVEHTRDALKRMHSRFGYSPELFLTIGNHEARIDRATSDASELTGAIGIDDLGYREHGWQCSPYNSSLQLGGFAISHHFASGVAGRPIGGMSAAANMARLLFTSAIVGHSHTSDSARRTRPDGSRVFCLVAGCYVAPDHHESWSAATEHLWWRGVVVLEDVAGGDAGEVRWITQDRMRALYGGCSAPPTPEPLDFDDVPETLPHAPPRILGNTEAARRAGVDESTVRFWRLRHGGTAEDYLAARGIRADV